MPEGLNEALRTIFAAGGAAQPPIAVDGARFLVHPCDWTHTDITQQIDRLQPRPRRAVGTIKAQSLGTFIDLSQELGRSAYETGTRRTYLDGDAKAFRTIFNDHEDVMPGWRDFAVEYKPRHSPEWLVWTGKNGKQMSQVDFAEFLEENIADIQQPEGKTLLAVATTLSASTAIQFKSHRRLDNGQVQLTYDETIDARAGGGALEIPRTFQLGLRVFDRGLAYAVLARLKYRLHSGEVKFWFEIDRPERVVEDALAQMEATLDEAGLKVYHGA